MSVAGVLFLSFIVLLLLNVPIALGLGLSSLAAMAMSGTPLDMLPMQIYAATGKFTLLAIPFFILAGNIMEKAGISEKLINLANKFVGHRKGGLAIVCVITSCFFAAISGSGPATVAALGVIIIPAMINAGYGKGMSSALMATSGNRYNHSDIAFVVYGAVAEVSIGRYLLQVLFLGFDGCLSNCCFIKPSSKLDVEMQVKASPGKMECF